MSLETVTQRIRGKVARAAGLQARVLFDFGTQGRVRVDTTCAPPVIEAQPDGAEPDADVTLACTLETFEAILDGTQDPNIAFMTGKLKIRGAMGLALKLNAILED